MDYHRIENTLVEKPLVSAFQLMNTEASARYDGSDVHIDKKRDLDRSYADNEDDNDDVIANCNNMGHKGSDGVSNIRLMDCLIYLRHMHCYCLFCGTSYSDEMDLVQNCPGIEEDDH